MARSLASRRNRPKRGSLRVYYRWAIASLVGLLIIIPSGGLVRLTKSGLGCPDWPGCHGGIVPEMTGHAAIEYSNRVASFFIMVTVLVAWLVARRVADAPAGLTKWAGAAALASVAQGPLGGLTVILKLHPLMVGSHFLLSLVALAPAVVAVQLTRDRLRGEERTLDPTRAKVSAVLLALLCAVVATGVVVTSSGPHSGDKDVTRRFWDLGLAATIHVRTVIAFVVVGILAMIWLARSGVVDRALSRLATLFVPLLIAQIILGEYQYRNGMHWQVIAFHVSVAGVLFSVGTASAWRIAHPPTRAQDPADALQASSTADA